LALFNLGFSKGWGNFFSTQDPSLPPTTKDRLEVPRYELTQKGEILERILRDNILPFWYPHVIDEKAGGYQLHHDVYGKFKGPANKCLVTQARTLWFFSRLANSNFRTTQHLEAANHGYEFLRDCMWDQQFGGFYWKVDPSGQSPTQPEKHLYGQAFGLYALSEFEKASGDSSATALAGEIFNLFERHAHDPENGGYRECFLRDWNPIPGNFPTCMNSSQATKTMNTHLHLMEAITSYYLATKDPVAEARLHELLLVQSHAVVRKNLGACTDKFQSNWAPLQEPRYDFVSYGHDLENVWLLMEACQAMRLSNGPLLDLYRTIFGYSWRYGYDRNAGGFYEKGPFNAPANRRDKIWWVQAEGLVSALHMYRLTKEEKYWNCFSQTLDWIVNHQVDWEHGEWFARVEKNGQPSGDKAGPWKSPYHNGRAMLFCLEALATLVPSC